MAEAGAGDEPRQLPADLPPPLRAAVAAALAWLRELDAEAADGAAPPALRRPR